MTTFHKTATAFLLAAALLLSGCAKPKTEPAQDTENISLDSNFSDSNSSSIDSEDTASSEESESLNDSESNPYIEDYPLNYISMPDGSEVSKYEAINDFGYGGLEFDFTFIRYASPVFRSTIDDPDLIDWEKSLGDFSDKYFQVLEDTVYFKIKPGDKLDNGLTVKSAEYWVNPRGNANETSVEFDGDLTLTGILRCIKGNEDRGIPSGELVFYPDLTKFDFIPIIVPIPIEVGDYIHTYADSEDMFAVVYDSARIDLGNINDLDIDISDVISPGENKKVKVTINDLYTRYWSGPSRYMSAEIVSVEPIT